MSALPHQSCYPIWSHMLFVTVFSKLRHLVLSPPMATIFTLPLHVLDFVLYMCLPCYSKFGFLNKPPPLLMQLKENLAHSSRTRRVRNPELILRTVLHGCTTAPPVGGLDIKNIHTRRQSVAGNKHSMIRISKKTSNRGRGPPDSAPARFLANTSR